MYTERNDARNVRAKAATRRLLWAITKNGDLFDQDGNIVDEHTVALVEEAVEHFVSKLPATDVWADLESADTDLDDAILADVAVAESELKWVKSEATRRTYEQGVRTFARYCLARPNPVNVLPADPRVVCAFLIRMAQPVIDPHTGEVLRDGLAVSTLRGFLAAIDTLHEANGHPSFRQVRQVRQTMQKLARNLGIQRTPVGKRAISLDQLEQMLATTGRADPTGLRDRTLAVLLAHPQVGPAAAADLRWSDVHIDDDGVRLMIGPDEEAVLVVDDDETIDPVRMFRRWSAASDGTGPVFCQIDGDAGDEAYRDEPLSSERICQLARDWMRTIGCPVDLRRPFKFDRLELVGICESIPEMSLADLRDRALALVGFYTAMRRSNLADLRIGDVYDTPDGVDIRMRWSKTKEAHTFQLFEHPEDPSTDPSRAVRELIAAIGRERGVADPTAAIPLHPLFPGLTRSGTLRPLPDRVKSAGFTDDYEYYRQVGMSTEAIAQVIKKRLKRIGVDPAPYAAHSLRAGVITAMAEHGFTADQIRQISRHRSLDTLFGYIRRAERSDSRMLHRLAIQKLVTDDDPATDNEAATDDGAAGCDGSDDRL